MKFISNHLTFVYVMIAICMYMIAIMCDQCIKCLWDLRGTLNMFRMSYGTTLVFMTWTNLASKSWL